MGNQCSEMMSQYTGRPGVNLDTVYNAGIQPFNLADHHREGNSKVLALFLFLFWIQFLQLSDQISVLIIKLNKKQNHHNPGSHQIRTPSVSVCSNMYTNMYP